MNEEGKASRECVVVRVEHEDEISNASAVLLETCRGERCGSGCPPVASKRTQLGGSRDARPHGLTTIKLVGKVVDKVVV